MTRIYTAIEMSHDKNIFFWVLQKKVYIPLNSMFLIFRCVYLENYDKSYIFIYC